MATKLQLKTFAKNNNVSMAAAKMHFLNEAMSTVVNVADLIPTEFFNAVEMSDKVNGGVMIQTPGGFQSFRTAVTGVEFYRGTDEAAEWAGSTAYGMSYVAQRDMVTETVRTVIVSMMVQSGKNEGDLFQATMTLKGKTDDKELFMMLAMIASKMNLTSFDSTPVQCDVMDVDASHVGLLGRGTVPAYTNNEKLTVAMSA